MLTRLLKLPETRDFFLFGARATGKTTLLLHDLAGTDSVFFDLLDPQTYEQFAGRAAVFRAALNALPTSTRTVVIDEVQREPALLDVVQPLMAKGRFRFVLTGSSARKLKRGAANLLGGRAVTRSLWPLVSWERPERPDEEARALAWGGLPNVVLAENDTERKDLLRSYVTTYLAEEVVAEQLVRNLAPFRKFLAVAAQMSGKIVNTSSIGRDVGTSHNTVASYFEILEETLVGFQLPAWNTSVRKRVRSKPKFSLFDTGVTRALSRTLEAEPRTGTSAYGDLFEQMFLCEANALRT